MKMNTDLVASILFSLTTQVFADARVDLGRALFFDVNLSKNRTQSCATCHNPDHGFVDKRSQSVAAAGSFGDDQKSQGDRSAPTAAYAMLAPAFRFDHQRKEYLGGQFWDGRAGDLVEQAKGPPLNPAEMAMKNPETVVARIKENAYYLKTFKSIFGEKIFSNSAKAYQAMAESIAAFEKSDFFAPFDSKYDRYLQGKEKLTDQEELGRTLFFSNNNTNCASCHMNKREGAQREPFTNFTYHNIGTPENIALRSKNGVPPGTIDEGLLNHPQVKDPSHRAKVKVPTLRNVAITAPYMHNGVFQNLETVVRFYDHYNNGKQTKNPETGKPWRKPAFAATVNRTELRAKSLSDAKVKALVAFMETLTDRRYEHLLTR